MTPTLYRYTWRNNEKRATLYGRLCRVLVRGVMNSALKDARPCDLNWVRTIREQCIASGTALFHKQHGGTRKIDGVWGGRVLDGRTWDEFPQRVTA